MCVYNWNQRHPVRTLIHAAARSLNAPVTQSALLVCRHDRMGALVGYHVLPISVAIGSASSAFRWMCWRPETVCAAQG